MFGSANLPNLRAHDAIKERRRLTIKKAAVFGVLLLFIIFYAAFGLFRKPGPDYTLHFYLDNLKRLNAEKAYTCIVYESRMSEPFEHFKKDITEQTPLIDYTIHYIDKSDDGSYKASVTMVFGRDDWETDSADITFKLIKKNDEWKLFFPEYKMRPPGV